MKLRSFLAFDIPDEAKAELFALVELLKPKINGINWIKSNLLHCTVKFFGDVEEDLLTGDIAHTAKRIADKEPPFGLKIIGVGVFPNWRYPKIIWAGLTGDVELAMALHNKLESAFTPFDIKKDERTFRLHLTLGRAKSPLKKCEPFINFVEKLADKEFGSFTVGHLTLYKSVLTKDGPIYTALREFALGGK